MFVNKLNMIKLLVLLLLPIHVLCNQYNDELSLSTMVTKSNDNTATSIKSSTLKNSKSFLSPNGSSSVVIVHSNVNTNDDGGDDGGADDDDDDDDNSNNNNNDYDTRNGNIINHRYPKVIKQLPSLTSSAIGAVGGGGGVVAAAVHNNNLYDEKEQENDGNNGDSDVDGGDNKNRFRRSVLVPESTSYIEPPITWNYLRRFICGTSNQKCMNDERLNSLKSDFLRQLSQKIPTDIDLRQDYFSNDMNIWNSLNLSGRREGPLYVEEPDFVVRKEDDDIAAQLFVDYLDDPFIPQRGRRRYDASSLFSSSSSQSSPSSTVDNNMKILILPIGSDASTNSINGFPMRRHLFDNSDDETKSVNSNYYHGDTYFKRGNGGGGGGGGGVGDIDDHNQKYINKKLMDIKRLKLISGGGGGGGGSSGGDENNGKLKTGKWLAAGNSFIQQQPLNNNEQRCCSNDGEDEQQQNYLLHQLLKDHHYHHHPQQQQQQQLQQQQPLQQLQQQQRYQPGQSDAFKLKLTKQQRHNDGEQNNRMHLIENNLSPPQNDRDIFYYTRGRRTTSK